MTLDFTSLLCKLPWSARLPADFDHHLIPLVLACLHQLQSKGEEKILVAVGGGDFFVTKEIVLLGCRRKA